MKGKGHFWQRGSCYFCGKRTSTFCEGCETFICPSCADQELDKYGQEGLKAEIKKYGEEGVPHGLHHLPDDHRIEKKSQKVGRHFGYGTKIERQD